MLSMEALLYFVVLARVPGFRAHQNPEQTGVHDSNDHILEPLVRPDDFGGPGRALRQSVRFVPECEQCAHPSDGTAPARNVF